MLPLLALAGCADDEEETELPPAPSVFAPLTDGQTFRETVVGKDLLFNSGVMVLNADGSFGGNFDGDVPTGQWFWQDGTFCRELTIGTRRFERECQRILLKDDRVQFVREDGSLSSVATIQ